MIYDYMNKELLSFPCFSYTPSILDFAVMKYSGFISIPIKFLSVTFLAATPVVPEPMNGSNIMSPGRLETLINLSIRSTGFIVGWS